MKRESSQKTQQIRQFILDHVTRHPRDIVKVTALHFDIRRQAVQRHIHALLDAGLLVASGTTSARVYGLPHPSRQELFFNYPLSKDLQEHIIWQHDIHPLVANLPHNVRNLLQYGCTEMINNAIDHSGGTDLVVAFTQSDTETELAIMDNGEGIFNKIKRVLQLDDARLAILELKKGKFTTDPARHSGEGIFFTSRMCDKFTILSDRLFYDHRSDEDSDTSDWLLEGEPSVVGTRVVLRIDHASQRTPQAIYAQYQDDQFGFSKTNVPVRLAGTDDNLVSRSQAKRLLARFDKFKSIILDFRGVTMIGQGFADEVFRVFPSQNPTVRIYPIYANEAVSQMISRAILSGEPGEEQ